MIQFFSFFDKCLVRVAFAGVVILAASSAHADSLVEVRTIDIAGTSDGQTTFQQVNFNKSFASAPVVVALPTNDGAAPAILRVRNVTATGFEIAPIEPAGEDGEHGAMTGVTYIAVAPGTHQLGGTTFEASHYSTGTSVGKATIFTGESAGSNNDNASTVGDFDNVTFSSSFSSPIVLAAIQSDNNEAGAPPGDPSSPWVTTVIDGISGAGFNVALQRSEADENNNGLFDINAAESIGWIAIESGSDSFMDDDGVIIDLQAFLSPDSITGWDDTSGNGDFISYANGAFADVPVVIATIAANDGADGGWIRRGVVNANGVFLILDEDRETDPERNHTDEIASILAFSQDFNLSAAVPEPTTVLLWLITGAAAIVFAWRTRRKNGIRP